MNNYDLQEYIETEGLEYALRFKGLPIEELEDKVMLKMIKEFIQLANKIETRLETNSDD